MKAMLRRMLASLAIVAGLGLLSGLSTGSGFINTAKAASPVCFTTPAGCYCIDFFTNLAQEQVWSKVQDELNGLLTEHRQDVRAGITGVLGGYQGVIGEVGSLAGEGAIRDELEQVMGAQGLAQTPATPEDLSHTRSAFSERAAGSVTSEARMDRQARAIASAYREPGRMAPYSGSPETANATVERQRAGRWAERMVPSLPALNIPDNESLESMPMADLLTLYDRTRAHAANGYARAALVELSASEERRQRLGGLAETLQVETDAIGVVQSASVHAEVLYALSVLDQLESELRKEQLKGMLAGLRMEGLQ